MTWIGFSIIGGCFVVACGLFSLTDAMFQVATAIKAVKEGK